MLVILPWPLTRSQRPSQTYADRSNLSPPSQYSTNVRLFVRTGGILTLGSRSRDRIWAFWGQFQRVPSSSRGDQFAKPGRLALDNEKPQGHCTKPALRFLSPLLGSQPVGCRPTAVLAGTGPAFDVIGGAGREGGRGVSQYTTPPCLSPMRAVPALALPATRR